MIEGAAAIRDAYRDDAVARHYIDQRFREPLGALLHDRQRRALQEAVGAVRPRHVLEIAPGPARLTVDVAPLVAHGTVIDASAQMLAVARARLGPLASTWR